VCSNVTVTYIQYLCEMGRVWEGREINSKFMSKTLNGGNKFANLNALGNRLIETEAWLGNGGG